MLWRRCLLNLNVVWDGIVVAPVDGTQRKDFQPDRVKRKGRGQESG